MSDNSSGIMNFIGNAIGSKIVGDSAVYAIFAVIGVASYYDQIWTKIPIMERFVFVPWLFFGYAYYLISKYEEAHRIHKREKKKVLDNYSYALYWGLIFALIHYAYIPFELKPTWKTHVVGEAIFGFYSAIDGLNNFIGSTTLKSALPAWEFLGVCIALYGSAKAGLARIYINGYWAKDIYDYKQDKKVITDGPYAKVRHPIYWGQCALVLGTAMVSGNIIMYVYLLIVFWLNKKRAEVEERELIKIFDKEEGENIYQKYKNEVQYFMINKIF